jgi:AmmeMemoRadiSam system protein A
MGVMRRFGTLVAGAGVVVLGAQTGCAGEGPVTPVVPKSHSETGEVAMIQEHRSGTWSPGLTETEKQTLFSIAMDTLAWCVKGGRDGFDFSRYVLTEKLKAETATFVTLKRGGHLRGCIGSLQPHEALYLSVHGNAVNAAMRDPRFRPLAAAELAGLEVHVSVLSPIRDIASVGEFKVGEHGIIIAKGRNQAVYLPEVAVEQGWTKEETLASLCEKAWLPRDAWKEGARFKVFSSVVLSQR